MSKNYVKLSLRNIIYLQILVAFFIIVSSGVM